MASAMSQTASNVSSSLGPRPPQRATAGVSFTGVAAWTSAVKDTQSRTPRVELAARGALTKTGNSHARRLLFEAALASPQAVPSSGGPAAAGMPLARLPEPVGKRPTGGYTHAGSFDECTKPPVVASAAITRELAGWCWSLAVLDE